jgi:hypothetical protein
MRARCCPWLLLRRGKLWHRVRIAFVVEALIGVIDRNAPRKGARSRGVVLNDDNLQAERAQDRLEAGGPHLFLRGTRRPFPKAWRYTR